MLSERLATAESPWTAGSGPECDVVLSSRVRLARNFKDQPFPNKQHRESALQVWRMLSDFCEKNAGFTFYDLSREKPTARQVLVEKHLISPAQAQDDGGYRAVVLSDDGRQSLMVNEEDHLRLQVFEPGLALNVCWSRANGLDDRIAHDAPYAFLPEWGYLTACPTNLGTGLRASVLLHLPGLRMTRGLGILQQLGQMGMAVRGLYGEGSESAGDFYQISNQQTLGRKETDIIDVLLRTTERLVTAERKSREHLLADGGEQLADQVWRMLGALRFARRLSSAESIAALSLVRMGVASQLIPEVHLSDIDPLYTVTQSGYLSLLAGQALTAEARDKARATAVRSHLKNLSLDDAL